MNFNSSDVWARRRQQPKVLAALVHDPASGPLLKTCEAEDHALRREVGKLVFAGCSC
jgi:hypothetical protein